MGDTRWTDDQQRVIDARNCNLLVSAAAGSGKTAVLVERIIKMITDEKNNVDIDRLLVVTFTNAAAAEMKTRVGEAIESRLLEEPDNEHLQRQASLLHNAQITTMHSFCQYVIRNYFHVIDIDPAFKVANENDMKIAQSEILAELIEQRYETEKDNENSAFHLFSEMFAHGRDDSKIESIVLELYGKAMSYPWPEKWLNSITDIYKCENVQEELDELKQEKKDIKRQIQLADGIIKEDLYTAYYAVSGKEEIVADRDIEIPGMEKEAVSEKDVAVEPETNVEAMNPDNNQNDTSVMPDIRNVSDVNTARMDEDITDVTGKSEFMESEEKVSVDKAGWIVRRISELGGYENISDSVKADIFGFDIADVSGSIWLFSDVMKRLGIKLDGNEMYEEFQRIYDESVGRDAGKDKAEDKMWNRGRGR